MAFRNLSLLVLSLFIIAACGGGGGGGESPTPPTNTGCSPSTTNLCITVRETGGGAYGGNVSRDYVVQNSSSAGVANNSVRDLIGMASSETTKYDVESSKPTLDQYYVGLSMSF